MRTTYVAAKALKTIDEALLKHHFGPLTRKAFARNWAFTFPAATVVVFWKIPADICPARTAHTMCRFIIVGKTVYEARA